MTVKEQNYTTLPYGRICEHNSLYSFSFSCKPNPNIPYTFLDANLRSQAASEIGLTPHVNDPVGINYVQDLTDEVTLLVLGFPN